MAGGGTEQGLQLHLQKYLDHVETGAPMPAPQVRLKGKDFGPGTPNHKGLRVVCDVVDEAPGALVRLADFLAMQEERGLMCAADAIETNTSSHWQLHAAWAGTALLWVDRHGDFGLEEPLRRWWWSAFALCEACEIPGAKDKPYPEPLVWGPGWRGKIDGAWVAWNPARDLCYSLAKAAVPGEEGEPYRRRLPVRGKKLWKDKYNNGARALSLLKPETRAALLPPAGWVPPLPYPFSSMLIDDGRALVAWFSDVPPGGDVARSAGFNTLSGRGWASEGDWTGPSFSQRGTTYPATSFERS